jgi:hypothetical protein
LQAFIFTIEENWTAGHPIIGLSAMLHCYSSEKEKR